MIDFDNLKLSDVREVRYLLDGSSYYTSHIIHKDQVKDMCRAILALHHSPGKNPYSDVECAEVTYIEIKKLSAKGPFWWTKPSLGKDATEEGVTLFNDSYKNEMTWRPYTLQDRGGWFNVSTSRYEEDFLE